MPKYALLQNYAGSGDLEPMENWSDRDREAHLDFQQELNRDLAQSGELLDVTVLAPAETATFVTADGGDPQVRQGQAHGTPQLAGYRLIEVSTAERAIEIAAMASAAPGPGGQPIRQPIEIREVLPAPGAEEPDAG